jgi:hypothetical protein
MAAALCTRNYHFFAAIAKQYPHFVAKIFLPEDYLPILLSGIIQDHAHSIITDLMVAFQFHLPYLTRDGCPTSFVVATRPQVSVSTVLGLLLITATGMIINTVDNIVEAKHLDCPQFQIYFSCTTKNIPAFAVDATTHYVAFEECMAFFGRPTPSSQECAIISSQPILLKSATPERTGTWKP